MKVLKKKLKKVHGAKKFFYFFSILIYIPTYIYFILGILKLNGIENFLRGVIIGFFGIWLIIYILCGLISMISKRNKTFIFITIITILFSTIFIISSYYINKVYGSLSNINNEKITYTTNLIALKETNFNDDLTIGMINSEDDIEGHDLAKKLIEKEKLTNKIETYDDYHSMISDLYKGKIGGCFVSSNYAIQFGNEEFETVKEGETATAIKDRVKVLYDYSEERENQDNLTLKQSKNKTLTEPFTVLVMGVDSSLNGLKANQAFNGDTLIMVTFNPSTLTATMFSIPRDLYVPIACNHDRYAKINSSAAYGSSCVINTVQKLTGIDIDYYVKINFSGVVELVDALGGVTVDVEEPDFQFNGKYDCKGKICEQNSLREFGSNMIYVDTGIQTLNGEQALAYARNRHQFAVSDIARNQHQQQIIEAMAKKLKDIKSLNDFENILNTVSHNLETNMTPNQILSFYNVGKDMLANSKTSTLSIKKTYLSYYSLPVYLPRSGMYTSALGYYSASLDAITDLMKVNLGLEEEKPVKTFSISYNEDYSTPLVGKGITGGTKLERVESFIGKTRYEANTWCQLNSISCTFETTKNAAEYGTIVDQSVHQGELVKSIKKITFQVSDGLGSTVIEKPDDEPQKPDNSNSNENENNSNSSGNNNNTNNNDNDNDNDKDNDDKENNNNESGETPNPAPTEPPIAEIPGGPNEE